MEYAIDPLVDTSRKRWGNSVGLDTLATSGTASRSVTVSSISWRFAPSSNVPSSVAYTISRASTPIAPRLYSNRSGDAGTGTVSPG